MYDMVLSSSISATTNSSCANSLRAEAAGGSLPVYI